MTLSPRVKVFSSDDDDEVGYVTSSYWGSLTSECLETKIRGSFLIRRFGDRK